MFGREERPEDVDVLDVLELLDGDLLDAHLDDDTTILGVFHDRAVVERLADRVLVMSDGRLERVVPVGQFSGEVVV